MGADDPAKLLADPNGMVRWYIEKEFANRQAERLMLLTAYDMRALIVLVDGIDEAAGLRDVVEVLT